MPYIHKNICSWCDANHTLLQIDKCTEEKCRGEYFYSIYFKNGERIFSSTCEDHYEWNWGRVWTGGSDALNSAVITVDGAKCIPWPIQYDINAKKVMGEMHACPGGALNVLVKIQYVWRNALKWKKQNKRYRTFVFMIFKNDKLRHEINLDVMKYCCSFL